MAVDNVWLVTHAAQPLDNRADTLRIAQSPLWGFGRVDQRASQPALPPGRPGDLRQGEIASLVEELNAATDTEDEIALHGELRYVRRLLPVSTTTVHAMGRPVEDAAKRFQIEVARPGILDSMHAVSFARRPPGPHEVEIEVAATGLNFMDLMLAMAAAAGRGSRYRRQAARPGMRRPRGRHRRPGSSSPSATRSLPPSPAR